MFLSNSSLSFLYTKAFPDKCYTQFPFLAFPDLIPTPSLYPPKFLTLTYPAPIILTPSYTYPTFPTPSSILPEFLKPKYSYPNILKPILTFPKLLTPTYTFPILLNPILMLHKLLTTLNLILLLTFIPHIPSTSPLPYFSTSILPLPLLFSLFPPLFPPLPLNQPLFYPISQNLYYLTSSLSLPISLTILILLILKMTFRAIPPNPTYPDQNPLTYHYILTNPVPKSQSHLSSQFPSCFLTFPPICPAPDIPLTDLFPSYS